MTQLEIESSHQVGMWDVLEFMQPVVLERGITELSFHKTRDEDDEVDLDAVLRTLNDGDFFEAPGSPASTYSDEGSTSSASSLSFVREPVSQITTRSKVETEKKRKYTKRTKATLSSSSSSSEDSDDGVQSKRKRNAGLSAVEKREQRKMRNRELAAESRRRKNEEMDRLRRENADLRERLAHLETLVPVNKRIKMGNSGLIGAGASAIALAAFVVMAPMEGSAGLHQTASVLVTILDVLDQAYRMTPSLGLSFFALVIAFLVASSLTSMGILLQASARSFGKLVQTTSSSEFVWGKGPKHVTSSSLVIANSV